jgi:DNA repair exonuclease SbcCD ATPase subunit
LLQDARISSLAASVAPLISQRADERLGEANTRIDDVQRQLADLQGYVKLDGPADDSAPLGRVVSVLAARMTAEEKRGEERKADVRRGEERLQELSRHVTQEVQRLEDFAAPKTALASLHGAYESLEEQMGGLLTLLNAKVGRGEEKRVEALASEVATYVAWKRDASTQLSTLTQQAEDMRTAVNGMLDSLSSLSAVSSHLSAAQDKSAKQCVFVPLACG